MEYRDQHIALFGFGYVCGPGKMHGYKIPPTSQIIGMFFFAR